MTSMGQMSPLMYSLLVASLVGATAGLAWFAVRQRAARLWPAAVGVALAGVGIWLMFPLPAATRAVGEPGHSAADVAAVVVSYVAMLLGMMAEYVYQQAEKKRKRFTFVPLTFVMPILVSPIVFIPLLTIVTEAGPGGAFTRARLMVYLVAFQSGFFWKGFLEQRRLESHERQLEAPGRT